MASTTVTTPIAHRGNAPDRPRGRRSTRKRIARALGYAGLVIAAAAVLLPFFWMVMSSLKTNNDVFSVPIQWIPKTFVWGNYVAIWQKSDMTTWLKNTMVLSLAVTALQLLTGSFAAYGFSKVRFPGRDLLFLVYIGTIAVPWQAYMIPQFILMSKLHLSNTLWSIVALQAFGAFGVFLMKQFYETVPEELSEAARIDGLSEYGIYRRIMLPLSVPALASLTLLTFTNTWNDYLGPLIYLADEHKYTLSLGLASFSSQYGSYPGMLMAVTTVITVPIIVIFFFAQRTFIQGITLTGIKG